MVVLLKFCAFLRELGEGERERERDDLSTASQTDSSDCLAGDAHYPPSFRELMKDLCKMQ